MKPCLNIFALQIKNTYLKNVYTHKALRKLPVTWNVPYECNYYNCCCYDYYCYNLLLLLMLLVSPRTPSSSHYRTLVLNLFCIRAPFESAEKTQIFPQEISHA